MPGRDGHGQLRLDMGAALGMEAKRAREGGAQPAGRHAEGSDIAPGQVENTVHCRLERDDFSSSRHPALPLCLSMIFSENR
jgi:hypothetical protein